MEIDPQLEQQYNVRALCADYDDLAKNWIEHSAVLRQEADALIDIAYGPGGRDKLDVFRCGQPDAPLLVFIHGGYWQRGDKSMYSCLTKPFLESGADVVLLGYELCPTASMDDIVASMRKALVWLWRNADSVGVCRDRINLSGHSAGGHLTAMMLTTDWSRTSHNIPRDLLKSAIPISGLYQLDRLRQTTIGQALQLDDASSSRNSPHLLSPASNAPVLVTLGGGETEQFHWQSDQFAATWRETNAKVAHFVEPDVDHFHILNRLSDPQSELFKRTRSWMR